MTAAEQQQQSRIFSQPKEDGKGFIVDIYLSGAVTAPKDYIEEFQTLSVATADDEVFLKINGPGGRIDAAIQWLAAIRNTKAKVTGVIEGMCHSAYTYLFLACDEWIVNPHCLMMIHNYSGGAGGKGKEILEQAHANNDLIEELMGTVYQHFLTKDEIDRVNLNQDIWLTTEEIYDRLGKVVEYRTALYEAAESEAYIELQERKENEESGSDSVEGSDSE
mgnify:CR=1 FL=1